MKDNNCIFCKIANGEIPSVTIYEDTDLRVILDMNPATKGHALILTKDHYKDITEISEQLGAKTLKTATMIGQAMKKSLGCTGFNIVINTGESAGQTVFHYHTHIIPRYDDARSIVSWTPGVSNPLELTETAVAIKKEL